MGKELLVRNGRVIRRVKPKYFYSFVKRIADFAAALTGIVLLSPLMIGVAIAVRASSPGPVIFRQKRLGRNGSVFTLLKFRSMYVTAPADVASSELKNPDEIITKVGKFIRRTSLDELPQLFNILIGQMSVIGPRPILLTQTDLCALRDANGASNVKVGLTGWAQVNGRDILAADFAKKAAYDGYYAVRRNLWFDIKIFFLTIKVVLCGSGVVEGDPAQELAAAESVAASLEDGTEETECETALRNPEERVGREQSV